jgi:CubicO group peptidase (beta-lactamase class C family)
MKAVVVHQSLRGHTAAPVRAIAGLGREGFWFGLCFTLVLASSLLAAGPALAQGESTQRGPSDAAEFEGFLEKLMVSEMARLDVPGAAVVMVRDGEVVSSRGYGFADVESQTPVDPAMTLFGIGSVTKPLTAVAAMQQVERGHLDLDADINTYLDFRVKDKNGTAVTLASLLTHTSGFEERKIGFVTRDADDVESLGELLRDDVPTRFAATGEVHSYSNHNYALVGHLVERVSGQDFVTYMDKNVFGPLGMTNTAFAHELPSDLASRLAVGYEGGAGSRRPADRVYDRQYPAGEVVATPQDMATFMIALLEGGQVDGARVMGKETAATYLAAAYRPAPNMPGRTTGGLEELWINGEQAVAHGGDTLGGFSAQMVLLPARRTGFFLVYNVYSDEFRTDVVDAVFDEFYPDQSPSPAFVELERDELGRFAGNYQWTRFARSTADKVLAMTPPYNTFVDANDDGTLTVRWLGVDESWDYRPTGPTTFVRVAGEPTVVDGLVIDPGARISFTIEYAEVRYLHTSLHTVALKRVPFLGLGIVHISAFGTIVIVFVLSLLIWAVGALVRKRRGRPKPTGWARGALWLAIAVAVALVSGTAAFFAAVSDADVAFGPTPALYLATGFITVGSIASLALIPVAVGSWINGWFTIGGRILYTLLALTAPYLLWWAVTWNLLGFRF